MVVSVRVCTLKSYFHFKLVVFTIRLRLGHREGQVLVRGGLSPLKTFKTACGMVNQQWVEFDFSLGTFVSWQPPPPHGPLHYIRQSHVNVSRGYLGRVRSRNKYQLLCETIG